MYHRLRGLLPSPVAAYVLHFEAQIDRAVAELARSLAPGVRVLDAGAGEAQYGHHFAGQRYCALDLGVGDQAWDYSQLDAIGDLSALPFGDATFDAALNIVTLEHVKEPAKVLRELGRVLRPGGRLLLVAPHEWEEHQQPHDYFRYTRYGLHYLLEQAGFREIRIEPVGGFFRLLARRMLNAAQFFPGPLALLVLILAAPAALVLPLFDGLDSKKNFTLGFVCHAVAAPRGSGRDAR